MAQNITSKRVNKFIKCLRTFGGSSGNRSLRKQLEWEEDLYWKVQGHLIQKGRIIAGRGRGGSVRLTDDEEIDRQTMPSTGPTGTEASKTTIKEKNLYPLLKQAIASKWINRFALDDEMVDETHSRGSKDTGGIFTRPDITAVGIRRFVYLPVQVEIVTFEVKTSESVNIMGVLEAIAHREAAHRAYVLYATDRNSFDNAIESERIIELAQKYGVGVVIIEDANEVETWEVLVDAVRHEPDPTRLDRFLMDLPSEEMKMLLSKSRG